MDFVAEFERAVDALGMDFHARGVLADGDRVYPFGTDTKVLSTVFELFVRPLIMYVAETHGMHVKEAPQTVYPDFTLLRDEGDHRKIAVDVKTTYRRPTIQFTLGSYTSFLRNNTKNILYPYDQYTEHWVVGVVYDRIEGVKARQFYSLEEAADIPSPYENVDWFVQEKFRISGESPGSGNTANIGSIRSANIEDFRQGRGPFAELGEDVFRDYWAQFDGKTYRSLQQYLENQARAAIAPRRL